MSKLENNFVRMVKRPTGKHDLSLFELAKEPVPDLKDGEFLMRNLTLSMDPAMVGRMRGEDNYAASVDVGGTMHAYGIGQVTESKNPNVTVGEIRLGLVCMQEYCIASDELQFNAINSGVANPTWYLSVCGMTGVTAFYSLFDLGKPKKGETILVSSGASSVGGVLGQIGKHMGCRMVGITSTQGKSRACRARTRL